MHKSIIWLLFAVIFKDGDAVTRGEREYIWAQVKMGLGMFAILTNV